MRPGHSRVVAYPPGSKFKALQPPCPAAGRRPVNKYSMNTNGCVCDPAQTLPERATACWKPDTVRKNGTHSPAASGLRAGEPGACYGEAAARPSGDRHAGETRNAGASVSGTTACKAAQRTQSVCVPRSAHGYARFCLPSDVSGEFSPAVGRGQENGLKGVYVPACRRQPMRCRNGWRSMK